MNSKARALKEPTGNGSAPLKANHIPENREILIIDDKTKNPESWFSTLKA